MQGQNDNAQPIPKLGSSKEGESAYFTQGFDLPPQQQAIRDRLLTHIPLLKTKTYRESLLTIVSSLSQLDKFSNNLEGKVDTILQAQENHFVDSYKIHVGKIKAEFEKMGSHIEQLQEKIRYYENEGKMSALVKKVFHLQQESAKLYKAIGEKDRKIKDLELTVRVQEQEVKRMQEAIKVNAREKSEILWREQLSKAQSNDTPVKLHDLNIFATQLEKKGSFTISNHQSYLEEQPNKSALANQLSAKSVTCGVQPHSAQHLPANTKLSSLLEQRLARENARLKVRNKKLMSFQARVVTSQNELQDFFVHCVQELKKEIRIRKKIDYCPLQEFKKQDKLLLLIKVLSNNEILTYLHQRLFRKRGGEGSKEREKGQLKEQQSKRLPRINFNLNYHSKV